MLNEALLNFILKDSQPFSIVKSEEFKPLSPHMFCRPEMFL